MRALTFPLATFLVALGVLTAACSKPLPEDQAFLSPDGQAWVHAESVAPDAEKDELLPSTRLVLKQKFGWGSPILVESLETLCGVHVQWIDAQTLGLRVPGPRAAGVRFKDGDQRNGLTLRLDVHEDQARHQAWSPDGLYRLVVVRTCETDDWNLYLRAQGEPTFNAAMQNGWDDPSLFGGFSELQPIVNLHWTGPRQARIEVVGKRYDVTVREKIGEVSLQWVFEKKLPAAPERAKVLAPL